MSEQTIATAGVILNPSDLNRIIETDAPSQTDPVSEAWHGLIVGFDPAGNEVTRQVRVTNVSKSWVLDKLEETASLLQRTSGFRWFNSSTGKSHTITLLHPTLNCMSFEMTCRLCLTPGSHPVCVGSCLMDGKGK